MTHSFVRAGEQITTRTFSYDYDKLFNAVMNVFMDRGYPIKEADKDTGLIGTDYKYMVSGRRKMNAKITRINGDSCKVRLSPLCEIDLGGPGKEQWITIEPTTGHKENFEELFSLIRQQLD